MAGTKLTRSLDGNIIGGVCAGIADHYGWSRGTVRWVFIAFGLFGAGELAYVILWLLMPRE